jgi:iron complex outermembrane recepter protein
VSRSAPRSELPARPARVARRSSPVPRLLVCYLLGSLFGVWVSTARSDTALVTDIAPQPVADALAEFTNQTGLQIVYESRIAKGRRSKGARAGLPPAEAVTQLLDGTGLSFRFLNERTVRIYIADSAERSPDPAAPRPPSKPAEHRSAIPPTSAEEVVVIGLRGKERLSQVPVSVKVWTAEALELSGGRSLEAIAGLTPGVEYDFDTAVGPGISTNLSIRGVNDAGGRSTSRLFVDGAPIHSLQSDFGEVRPLLFDIERVEILRGPQSTLLGEGTEGGAVRFLYHQPSLTSFSGQARSEVATTAHGSPSYEAGAAAGGPVVHDVVGFRASAWYRRDGGYVDRVDPFTGAPVNTKSNWSLSKSARLALTVAPADGVRITPSVSYQSVGLHDSPIFYATLSNPAAGVFRNGKLLQEPTDDSNYIATVNVTANFPLAELASVTSYFRRKASALIDYTNSYPNYFLGQFGPLPVYPVAYGNAAGFTHALVVDSWTQDLRLRSRNPDARLTWGIGLFYSDVSQEDLQTLVDSAVFFGESDPQFNLGATIDSRIHERQVAAFGEVDFKISTKLSASVGFRLTRDDSHQLKGYTGLTLPLPVTLPPGQSDTTVAPRFALTYQANDDRMLYATVAKGYRSAGIDPPLPFPCTNDMSVPFGADSVWSYEAGTKNTFFGGRGQLDLSAFFMHWENLHQLLFSRTSCGQVATQDSATSRGFDLAVQAFVTHNLKTELAVGYTDAHFSDTTYISGAGSNGRDYFLVSKGDWIGTLPQVPSPWTVTAAIDYDIALAGGMTADFRLQDVSRSHNPGPFFTRHVAQGCCLQGPPYPTPPWAWSVTDYPQAGPATNVVNVRTRLSRSNVDLSVFLENAFNAHPLLLRKTEGGAFGVVFGPPLVYATTFRPRTVGLAVDVRF